MSRIKEKGVSFCCFLNCSIYLFLIMRTGEEKSRAMPSFSRMLFTKLKETWEVTLTGDAPGAWNGLIGS
jgi:hypothetical protein